MTLSTITPSDLGDSPPSSASGRSSFLHPERVLGLLDIRPGMIVADFGAGGGYFSIAAARLVGEHGKIYAIDIQQQAIDLIKSKANLEHLLQLDTIWADLEFPAGSRLHAQSVDFVLVSNILFQAERKREIIAEAWRVLKPGGRLAILEWDEAPFPAGPPMAMRVPREHALRLARDIGFQPERELDAGNHHYGLLFKK